MPHTHEFTAELRLFELEVIKLMLPERSRILEIGAGAGWQAKRLVEAGHHVDAIEYRNPGFAGLRTIAVYPVEDYDGTNIPFADGSFDVVFSSNVLEHIPHQDAIQTEIRRVLRPGGIAVHVMPTSTWRFWSWLTHYVFVLSVVMRKLTSGAAKRKSGSAAETPPAPGSTGSHRKSIRERAAFYLIPERHGTEGNVLTEIWYFSRWRWFGTFDRTGFSVLKTLPTGLFCTGYGMMGPALGIDERRRLSRILGSACRIYLVQPKTQ